VYARHVKHGSHLPLVRAVANQRSVAACAKRKRQRIEQDGFARTGLARKYGQAGLELDVEPFNQDNIADR